MVATIGIVVDFNRFGPISRELGRKVSDALDTAALTIVEVADPLTPVDTGALKANKTINRSGDSVTVTWNQEYAAYNELGTIYMSPRPFARPGLEAAEPQFLASLRSLGA
jgi:HK97 gp10 family phage protein